LGKISCTSTGKYLRDEAGNVVFLALDHGLDAHDDMALLFNGWDALYTCQPPLAVVAWVSRSSPARPSVFASIGSKSAVSARNAFAGEQLIKNET
jgi:hypothetical protein